MSSFKMRLATTAMAAALLASAGAAHAQMGGGGGAGGMAGLDMTAIRDQMLQRFQTQIEATDEEWKVIQPRFMKVMQLQMDTGGGLMGMIRGLGGRGGARGGAGGGVNQIIQQIFGMTEPSPAMRREQELQDAIDNNASADRLKDRLQGLRDARARAKEELVKAQASLIEVLSLRQEAMLVQMGLID